MIRRPPRSTRTDTLSLHDALPIWPKVNAMLNGLGVTRFDQIAAWTDADIAAMDKRLGNFSGRIRSEEHTSELQSLMRISYAVFCLKKKNKTKQYNRQLSHD